MLLKALIVGLVLASGIYYFFFKKEQSKAQSYTLEQQIEILKNLGIALNDDVTVDDLLNSFDRDAYETEPFDLILFVYGVEIESEPWGRRFSNNAWNFDVECIVDNGSYIEIVKNFALLSKHRDRVENIKDSVDFEKEEAWVSYSIDGVEKRYDAEFDNDWADPVTVISIMSDLTSDGYSFYAKDNGQASVWFYLDEKTAQKLNEYSNNALVKN
jgi:hypothetical protein